MREQTALPTNVELGALCRDYLRGLGAKVRWKRGETFIQLPATRRAREGQGRRILVWMGIIGDHCFVTVDTPEADDVTRAVGAGLERVIRRRWGGARGKPTALPAADRDRLGLSL